MTNTILLRKIIDEKGVKYQHLAGKLNLSGYGLQKKIDNESEFKASEILIMSEELGLSKKLRDEIFLSQR